MECAFCRLIRDDTACRVSAAGVSAALTPLNPLAPGHTLVVPTAHYCDVFDVPPAILTATMTLVQRVAVAMRVALDASGVNILNASGPGSGQSVPHLHFHVVPRWRNDGISTWPRGRSRHQLTGDVSGRLADALASERHH